MSDHLSRTEVPKSLDVARYCPLSTLDKRFSRLCELWASLSDISSRQLIERASGFDILECALQRLEFLADLSGRLACAVDLGIAGQNQSRI